MPLLGVNEMSYDWDFVGGEAEFKKAFELDPSDATAHMWYALAIAMIGGREQEAIAEVNRAYQLDLRLPAITEHVGAVHNYARQFDEVIAICKQLANENPTFAPAHSCLLNAYWGKRMYPQVIEEYKAYARLSGDRDVSEFASAMDQGFRSGGWKAALRKGVEIRQAQRKSSSGWGAWIMACFYAELGEKDQAFRWLNTAYSDRNAGLMSLKTDFALAPLRSDSRFAELVRKVGLPQ